MNILFCVNNSGGFSENFYLDIKNEFQNELEKKYEKVNHIQESFPNKKQRTIWFKLLRELSKKKIKSQIFKMKYNSYLDNHYEGILKNVGSNYNYFISIGGFFSKEFMEKLKNKNPGIKTVLFIWDKYEVTEVSKTTEYYDEVYSFDMEDSKEYNLKFRPSFYVKNINKKKKDIDLYYVGAFREKKRYEYCKKLYEYCERRKMKSFIKIFSKEIPKDLNKTIFTKNIISYNENLKFIQRSKVVLELNYEDQKGLTLRSLECLTAETKLITNNKNIKFYDFYNENNILILERVEDIEKIPESFFKTQYTTVDKNIVEKYSVKGFIEEILK